jgi:hypothetical protein
MLLVAIIIGGIIALRMIPEENVIVLREKEENLQTNLSQIRAAFALKEKEEDPTWNPDLTNKPGIDSALQDLVTQGYLRDKDIKDPTVFDHLWGLGANDIYWESSTNIASNTSFEEDDGSGDGDILEWVVPTDTDAATDSVFLTDPTLDDFPHHNKLGNPFRNSGATLEIIK